MDSQELANILSRVERCEMELQSARAYIKALEQGLHAAIVTHGDPLRMGELWDHVLVEIAEGQTDGPEKSQLYHASFQAALAAISAHVDGAVRRRHDENDGRQS